MSKAVAEFVLWANAAPQVMGISPERYLINEVLRIRDVPGATDEQVIYAANSTFTLVDEVALNRWNSARADLVAAWVEPPTDDIDAIQVQLEPPPDQRVGYWLLSYVLGYSDEIIEATKSNRFGDGEAMLFIPLIRDSAKVLKSMIVKDEVLTAYHRARYTLLRFYLDAYFHAPI